MTERTAERVKPSYYLTSDGRVVVGARRSRIVIILVVLALLVVVGVLGAAGGVALVLTTEARTPREWAAYLQQRNFGNATLEKLADRVADRLAAVDPLGSADGVLLPAIVGAAEQRSGNSPAGHVRTVSTVGGLRDAVASALPNDVILLGPGTYRITGGAIQFTTIGNPNGPITVRAGRLGDAVIESDVVEAFNVSGPFWRFENLVMRGVCADHSQCEHAIHVVGAGTDVEIRNNRIEDFNAHLKINGYRADWPDRGIIEGNTLLNTAPRMTHNPITPIDLVAGSDWVVRGNFIADFARGVPGGATYGAFFKGAGEKNVFDRNVVLCAWKLHDATGPRVGVSLGGGGTDPSLRRDGGTIGMEQVGGVIRDNLIAFCSDAGIYLNRAARSMVMHNTLLDTAGIDGRFLETSGDITANIVDGAIRGRDGASLNIWENDAPLLLGLFVGQHPQRGYFRDPARLDLAWTTPPADLPPDPADNGTDLCGQKRGVMTRPGAFDDYASCLARP